MLDRSQIIRSTTMTASIAIVFVWMIIGLYVGFAGLVKIQIETLKEIARVALPDPVKEPFNGLWVEYRSPQDREYIVAHDNALNSTFRWTFQIPAPLPHVLAALAFGILGSIVKLLKKMLPKTTFPDLKTLLLRPIFGSLIAFMLLGVIAIVPSVLTIDETTLRPSSLLFICFLGGAFAEHVWSWLQSNTTKILPKVEKNNEEKN